MKITFETETENCFSFLDIKINGENDRFTTSIFRKPTFSGVFLNYRGFIHDSFKKSLIFTLLFRCYSICSNLEKNTCRN